MSTAPTALPLRRYENKVAVVTASTEGIGFAIAQRFAQEGAKVVISSRKQNNVDNALAKLKSQNLECHGMVCDAAIKEQRQKLLEETANKYGGIDILVSNAAANMHMGNALTLTESQWDKIFDTNTKATFFLIKEAIPYLSKRKNSSILLVASAAGLLPSKFPRIIPYAISKTAVIAMARGLSRPCADLGIRINCLAPGPINTEFIKRIMKVVMDEEPEGKTINTKMKQEGFFISRPGDPSEVCGAAAFLCSDEATYITGETLVIAGGFPSRL